MAVGGNPRYLVFGLNIYREVSKLIALRMVSKLRATTFGIDIYMFSNKSFRFIAKKPINSYSKVC